MHETEYPVVDHPRDPLLAERGADPNLQDEKRSTALIECAWDADAALMLIKRGANVNAQN
jgi:hypothetical protein